jgi:hypothetical protein
MLYKALGFGVWKGAKWYVGRKVPSRRLLVSGAAALTAATVVAVVGVKTNGD